ncbi:hypothetical protein DL96DRAFT_112758 [Flagelloscypha sp. PMI_526]|nr:hypothetical protein DL96DRAFT_112758 [Flagelloscypha sp. PMI_526]
MSLEQLPEDESGEEVVLVGPPPKNLRTLSTGSVQSLPYMSREHAQLILTNPDLPSPPISPADSLLPRLNVPATIDEEGSLSSKSASTSPSSIDSKELKTPERLTVVLLPDRPYYGIEPVEKSLSRKNSTPRSSPWDGPVARGPKRSKRSSQPHTPSPLRSNPSRISPASSSDSEDDYPPRSYTSGLSPLVGTNALLMSHMGYLTPQITPPHQGLPTPRSPPSLFSLPRTTA